MSMMSRYDDEVRSHKTIHLIRFNRKGGKSLLRNNKNHHHHQEHRHNDNAAI